MSDRVEAVRMLEAVPRPGGEGEVGIGLSAPPTDGAAGVREGTMVVQGVSTLGHRIKFEPAFRWIDRDILMFDGGLPFDSADLIAAAERLERLEGAWRPCTVIDKEGDPHHNYAHRDTDEVAVSGRLDPTLLSFEAGVILSLNAMAQLYRGANEFAIVTSASTPTLLRYRPGQHFGLHVDVVNRDGAIGGRLLSYVAFLNEPEEGGELEFPRQGLRIKPAPGRAVLFPSGLPFPHRSHPVVRGAKYALVSWLH